MKIKKSTIAKFLFLISAIIVGLAYVFIRQGVAVTSPFNFLFFRFLIATIILFVIFHKRIIRMKKDALKAGLIIGIPFAIAVTLIAIGLQTTTASKAGFIGGLYIIIVPILLRLINKTVLKSIQFIAIAIAVLGLGIVSLQSDFSIALGDVFVFFWSVFFAIYIVFVGKYVKKHDVVQITFVQFVFTLVISGIFALLTSSLEIPEGFIVWRALIFVSVFVTVINYLVQNQFQRYISEVTLGQIYSLQPIFAAISAYLILGEIISPRLFLGGGLIVFALVISELHTKLHAKDKIFDNTF